MSSRTSFQVHSDVRENATADVLRWRSWPLAEHPRWSWAVPVGTFVLGGGVAYLSDNWAAGIVAVAVMAAALWHYLLPVTYEIHALEIRRRVLRRARTVPWHAVRAYRPLATGVVLYQRLDPTAIDALRSLFIPYPPDQGEMLCAVRDHLGHAVELP